MEPPEPHSQPVPLLRQFLADRDAECPVCRYNLRALKSDRCPECGAKLDLRIGSTDLKLGPWLTALLGLALPFGFFGILLAVVVGLSLYYQDLPPADFTLPTVCASLVYGLCVWGIVSKRRYYWTRRPEAQRIAAAAVVLLSSVSATAIVTWLWNTIW